MYPNLFSKGKIGNRVLKNRILYSPIGDNFAAPDGSVTDLSIAYYTERAKGGTALICPGVVCVDYPRGKAIASSYRIDGVKYIAGWSLLARNIHRYGSLLVPQITFVGQAGDIENTEGIPPFRVSDPEVNEAQLPSSKVDLDYDIEQQRFETITTEQLKELEYKYIKAAQNLQLAGCDGVQVHCISYLIGQLATPVINKRTDEYGGSLENRLRFPLNVIRGIRKVCGPDFIISARIPVHMWETDGFSDEESIQLAKMYEEAGCDLLEANGGLPPRVSALMESQRYPQGARVLLAEKIKPHVNIPVATVGGLREPDFCEQVIEDGKADFIQLGRALLIDPYWPLKAQRGTPEDINRCISCLTGCFGNLGRHQPIQCVLNPLAGMENEISEVLPVEKDKRKKVMIVGGGLAGMTAAITAFDRGHQVKLFEATDKLGGQVNIASVAPDKKMIEWVNEYNIHQLNKRNVEVFMNTHVDFERIKNENPDFVIVATGSEPNIPKIDGIEQTIQAWEILKGKVDTPKNQKVAILGGGTVGCELAELMAEHDNEVTIIEMSDSLAHNLESINVMDMNEIIDKLGIKVELNSKVSNINNQTVQYEKDGETISKDFDYFVLSMGQHSVGNELVEQLEKSKVNYVVVGDAHHPSEFMNATKTGFFAGYDA